MAPLGSCGQVPLFPHHIGLSWVSQLVLLYVCDRQVSDSWGSCLLLTNRIFKTGYNFSSMWICSLTGGGGGGREGGRVIFELSSKAIKIRFWFISFFSISSLVIKTLTFSSFHAVQPVLERTKVLSKSLGKFWGPLRPLWEALPSFTLLFFYIFFIGNTLLFFFSE